MWVGRIDVLCNKSKSRGNVRPSASYKPIDTPNNDLIDLSYTSKIRINGGQREEWNKWVTQNDMESCWEPYLHSEPRTDGL